MPDLRKKTLAEFSQQELDQIVRLRLAGRSPDNLARTFGTSNSTIRKIYQLGIFG